MSHQTTHTSCTEYTTHNHTYTCKHTHTHTLKYILTHTRTYCHKCVHLNCPKQCCNHLLILTVVVLLFILGANWFPGTQRRKGKLANPRASKHYQVNQVHCIHTEHRGS